MRVEGQDLVVGAYQRTVTTSYSVFTCTPALVVTTSTKARNCDGPIAVATTPSTGLQTQIIRANNTNIQGDFLTTSTLADVTTGQAIGTASTPINQIAACYRSVANSGAFRCYAFWSAQESATLAFLSKFNFVDTAGTIGTQANFVRNIGVASRAFDYGGSVYVWMAFAEATSSFLVGGPQIQNTYFLYRDDAAPVTKAAPGTAGGYSPTIGHLPGVALTDGSTGFTWCATARRKIPLGNSGVGYAAREPLEVTFTFDSNEARRTARLGRTLYVSGGEVLEYDGARLVEVGFSIFPYTLSPGNGAGPGSMADGVYSYKVTWRYPNAQGEQERSTTASIQTVTVSGGGAMSSSGASLLPLTTTRKTASPPAVEIWRTVVNAPDGSPFYLVTSQDPAALTNPNRYIPNDPTVVGLPAFTDFLADASITELEANPENGSVLESLAPPGAKIIIATDTRLLIAGIAGRPDEVWYSRLRGSGEIASFHDTLRVSVPRPGGDEVTAVWFDDNGTLFAARRNAVYAFAGQGKDNQSQGSGFVFGRIISDDVGVISQDTVARTPRGMIFKSVKGWQLIRGDGTLEDIGIGVSDFDAEDVLSVDVVETKHEVRILTASRMIVWDYRANQWGERTISDGLHSCVWNGQHVYLTATGPKIEGTDYTSVTYGLDVETTWIKLADLQGAARCRKMQPLGEARSACLVRWRIGYNYKAGYVDDFTRDISALAAGDPLQFKIGPRRPQCQAIKLRLTAVTDAVRATLAVTSGSFSVSTSGTAWTATLRSLVLAGEHGNLISLSMAFETTTGTFSIDVRDHFAWSIAEQRWTTDVNNVGVRVQCRSGSSPTVAQLEAAIAAESALVSVTTPDPTPSKIVDAVMLAGVTRGPVAFTGGVFGSPTGEGIKLTSLGLEVGIEPGLFRRLPPGVST